MAYTLARIDEALRLRWEDVNFEHAYIRLWTRKTKSSGYRSRDIPMKDYMKSIMRELWENREQDEWVFLNRKTGSRFNRRPKLMAAICKRAGIPTYGFHAIRHFVSSYLLDREKIGRPTVGLLLGHRSLSTTDIYAHSINVHSVDDSMERAIDRLEGVFIPKMLPATGCGSGTEDNRSTEKGAM